MGYGKEIYERAETILRERRGEANRIARKHREEIAARCPRVLDLEREIARAGVQTARIVLGGGINVQQQIAKLAEQNLAQQAEQKRLMAEIGLPLEYLEPQYECPVCKDEGFCDGIMCECMRVVLREVSYQRLNAKVPLAQSTFDRFDLSYYSDEPTENGPAPRRLMENNYRYCVDYAARFSPNSESILMTGPTGLGKTHLSFAIAKEVIDKGYGVIYGSAQNLIQQLEKEHFGRGADENTEETLLSCDLLILDDLGAEFSTQFSTSVIYNLVNTRLLDGKPTIVSTNLSIAELEKQYTQRVVSRMIGSYRILPFAGKDVRQQRRMQEMNRNR